MYTHLITLMEVVYSICRSHTFLYVFPLYTYTHLSPCSLMALVNNISQPAHFNKLYQSNTTYRMVVIQYLVQLCYKLANIYILALTLVFLVTKQQIIYTKDGNTIKSNIKNTINSKNT